MVNSIQGSQYTFTLDPSGNLDGEGGSGGGFHYGGLNYVII